jgi:HTH-type transcriptional regulator/antitoxin HigA
MTEPTNRYVPRRVSPPGGTLLDLLEERGMAQNELADRTGLTPKTINEIVRAKAPITPDTALKLERSLGVPADFWLVREQHYQEWLARNRAEEEEAGAVDWLAMLPVKSLVKAGLVARARSKGKQVGELLRFFGVATPAAWSEVYASPQASFRRSRAFASDVGATAAWLRVGELQAQLIKCEPYQADRFRLVLKAAVPLTRRPFADVVESLRLSCSGAGVAVALVPQVEGCGASGVARWLSSAKALIQLSDRHKTEDHLWFTFFHEAAHLLLHGKKAVYLDDGGGDSSEEKEADRFAQDSLLPSREYAHFRASVTETMARGEVEEFADRVGVAPGIIVGRLHHEGVLPFRRLNELKVRLELSR